MSKCLYCESPTEMSKRGFPKKYCSDRCMHRYHHWKKTGKKIKDNVGEKTRLKKQAREERKQNLKWHTENWLTAKQLTEILNVKSISAVFHRSKSAGVSPKMVSGKTFWNPEDVDMLKLVETPIPEGYLTLSQAAAHLSVAKNTFAVWNKDDLEHIEFNCIMEKGNRTIRHLYKPEDLDRWNEKRIKNRAKEVAERNRLRKQATIDRREQKIQDEIQHRAQETKGLVNASQAAKRLGVRTVMHHVHKNNITPVKKAFGKLWFDPADIDELKIQVDKHKAKYGTYKKVILRDDDYTSVEAHENKLFDTKIPKMLKNPAYISKKTGRPVDSLLESIAKNEKWHENRTKHGIIKIFTCTRCKEVLPYTSFLFAKTRKGRKSICKACRSIENKAKYNPEYQRAQRKKNYVSKMRTIIGIQIKRDISLNRKKYAKDLSIPDIWNYIEEKLGYTAQGLCAHLESQFDDKMNWNNHARNSNSYHWQMDHIIPRRDLPYISIYDENFLKCWDLSNIRPLEASLNRGRNFK